MQQAQAVPVAGAPPMQQAQGVAMAMPGQPMMAQAQPMMAQPGQPMMAQPGQPMMAPAQPMMVPQQLAPQVIVQQPMQQMSAPPLNHFLDASTFVTVKQEVEILEVITGFETENEYQIIGIDASTLQPGVIGKAFEQSDCCTRQLCGSQREFEMRIQCAYGNGPKIDVLSLERPFRCCQSPCCCLLQELTVHKVANQFDPNGMVLGKVEEIWSACGPRMNVLDSAGNVLYMVEGPCIRCDNCFCDVTFELKAGGPDGPVVGILKKQAGDALTETFTDADTFGLQYPQGCPTEHKALLLSVVFLIDMMFFEKGNDDSDMGGGFD